MIIIEGQAKKELLERAPINSGYDSSLAESHEYLKVTAVLKNGRRIELKSEGLWEYGYAHRPAEMSEASSVSEQIKALGEVTGLYVEAEKYESWADQESDYTFQAADFDSGLPELGSGDRWTGYCPLEPLDWPKIRRRFEDAIRKRPELLRAAVAATDFKVF